MPRVDGKVTEEPQPICSRGKVVESPEVNEPGHETGPRRNCERRQTRKLENVETPFCTALLLSEV